MALKKRHQLAVGLVVIVSLVIFAVTILIIGQETRLFVSKVTYRTNFAEASGLRVGSPVTMAGVRVGNVQRIVLPTDPTSEGIEVFISVDQAYAPRVREGTQAKTVFLQFVANEKAVDLTPGDPLKPALEEGDFIPPEETKEILETGRTIADTLEEITADLREVLGAMRRGEGLLGKAIVDPEFGSETITKLNTALEALGGVLSRVEHGEGLVGKALADEALATAVSDNLKQAISSIAAVAQRLEGGEGLLGQLTVEGQQEQILDDVARGAEAFRRLAERAEASEGLLDRLVDDEQLAARLSANLDETFARLASIARKIDEGEGSLGLLVNEATLHDDIDTLITGMRSSRLMSWLIRRYHRKGEKQIEKELAEAESGARALESRPE
ncbi:MAG: MCE family protein [Acidobacteriota bacterium]|nr:MAG: MCE family protein [Acidobacteriota bacterium]